MIVLVAVATITAVIVIFKIADTKQVSDKRTVIIIGSSEIARGEIGREERHDSQYRKGNQPVQFLASFFPVTGNMSESFIRNSFRKGDFWRSVQRARKAFRNILNEKTNVFSGSNGFVIAQQNQKVNCND